MKKLVTALTIGLFSIGTAGGASASVAPANLIENGTFDIDLTEWVISGDLSTFWDSKSQTAHIGRPGTPGTSLFSQTFDADLANALSISFEYEWQINPPDLVDIFSVNLRYSDATGSQASIPVYSQTSTEGLFGSTISFNETIDLPSFTSYLPDEYELTFSLVEANPNVGTRIQLDNVEVNAVPLPAAVWLLGTGIIGLAGIRMRK